jgi:hypothetical protein
VTAAETPGRDRRTGRPHRPRSERSGDPGARTAVHRIGRIHGRRLWSVRLTSEHTPLGPRIAVRQRWTGPVLSAVAFLTIGGLIFGLGSESDWPSAVGWLAALIVAPWMAATMLARRAFVIAGPEGLTTLGNLNLHARTVPWAELEMLEVCYLGIGDGQLDTMRTIVSVRGPVTDGALRGVASLWALSDRRNSRHVGLVLLATAHRYGVNGVYIREGREATLLGADDFRYFDAPTPVAGAEPETPLGETPRPEARPEV